ncbi:TPA: hypothetical protein DCE37_21965 [Candidatus Latescibacteria bacterium]|nr:hypothetical protein [Candidatus Latescibacterota bacterium]
MRVAMISDVHSTTVALDILEDIEPQGGVDEYWFLGDHANQVYDPMGMMVRLDAIEPKRCVTGNSDRYLVDGSRRGPFVEHVLANPELLDRVVSAE